MARPGGYKNKVNRGHDPYMGSYTSRRANRLFPRGVDDDELDSNSSQRKRVPVACNRCRKRKIRCSGDDGNGTPCHGCATSKITEPCRFLRVSAQDFDMSEEFAYNLAACRQYQAANLQGVIQPPSPGMMPYHPLVPSSPGSVGDGSMPVNTSANNSSYLYGTRTMYPINGTWTPPYSADGSVSPIYQTVPNTTSHDAYSMGIFQGSRQASQSSLYSENHAVYNYNGEGSSSAQEHQGQQRQHEFVRRSTPASPDRDAFSLHSVANALHSSSGNPNGPGPGVYRSVSTSMQAYSRASTSSIPGNMSPVSGMPNAHPVYQSYETLYNGNTSPFAASQMSRMAEHYAPAPVTSAAMQGTPELCIRPAGPSPEMAYRYGPVSYINRPLRSSPMPAMIPSQQYMLSGTQNRRSVAYMTPGSVDEEEQEDDN